MYEDLAASIKRLAGGETAALDRVVQLLYDELRGLARQRLRSERGTTRSGATALVNEAYLRLARQHKLDVEPHPVLRGRLDDHASHPGRLRPDAHPGQARRGAGAGAVGRRSAVSLRSGDRRASGPGGRAGPPGRGEPEAASLVEHRFFSGLTVEEIAEMRGVSSRTLQREWVAARAWLGKEVARDLGLPD
ncbi:MAG: hypothetical protein IPK72_17675 [Candidatus Eisenbacteria bacterium]|nr:hypothetical protein [Candidatus Eisenbacteria bacterium]